MRFLLDWLDQRTGCKRVAREALYENIPGGSRWRYVWGSTLAFALFVQFVTGIFLWMAYSPSTHTAWESVYYIQYEMTGGWFLRGLHHYTAQVMIILLVLHLMQVVIDGAYKAPREVNFWFGVILLLLVMALSLTGYLLPWDQKGFWATQVTTNLAGMAPVIGPAMQKVLVGGSEYGHHTLTRFFALHAGVLPGLVIAMLVGHIYLFRRHGITAKKPLRKPDQAFWPDQLLKDAVACLAVLAAVLFLILQPRLFDSGAPLGAHLGPPADPSQSFSAARPEWYFLFLFQFLKYFPGESEIWGAIIIPSLVIGLVFMMPFIGRWKLGHGFNVMMLIALLMGSGLLTYLAFSQDRRDPHFRAAVESARMEAARVKALAGSPAGIPPTGALGLLRDDPLIQGPKLFAQNCASCHRFDGHDGLGGLPEDPPSAPDLKGFASREWLAGLLDPEQIDSDRYFGGTAFADGEMARWVKRNLADLSPEKEAELGELVIGLSAEAQLKSQRLLDAQDAPIIARSESLLEEFGCVDCHQFYIPDPNTTGPDLTGYGSREWLIGFVSNPAHDRFYGEKNDRMPEFGTDRVMTAREIELVVDWLRLDWYEPGEAEFELGQETVIE